MIDLCDEPDPDDPEARCDKPKPCFSYHCDSVRRRTWGFRDIPGDKKSDPGRVVDLVRRIRQHGVSGP